MFQTEFMAPVKICPFMIVVRLGEACFDSRKRGRRVFHQYVGKASFCYGYVWIKCGWRDLSILAKRDTSTIEACQVVPLF